MIFNAYFTYLEKYNEKELHVPSICTSCLLKTKISKILFQFNKYLSEYVKTFFYCFEVGFSSAEYDIVNNNSIEILVKTMLT